MLIRTQGHQPWDRFTTFMQICIPQSGPERLDRFEEFIVEKLSHLMVPILLQDLAGYSRPIGTPTTSAGAILSRLEPRATNLAAESRLFCTPGYPREGQKE